MQPQTPSGPCWSGIVGDGNHAAQVDNVLWGGKVADDSIQDEDTIAIRELNAKIVRDDRCLPDCRLLDRNVK